ncbi:hypothetical protein LCGC14_0987370, partial [marine sediment metagenome]
VKPRPFARTLNMFLDRGDVVAGRQPSARARQWQPAPRAAAALQNKTETLSGLRAFARRNGQGTQAGALAIRLAHRMRRGGAD